MPKNRQEKRGKKSKILSKIEEKNDKKTKPRAIKSWRRLDKHRNGAKTVKNKKTAKKIVKIDVKVGTDPPKN